MSGPASVVTYPQVQVRSPHLADTALQAFLQPDFDPADYLNNTLPPLATSTSTSNKPASSVHQQQARVVPLNSLSSQLQGLLTQLNAQATRLSNALTQLTDEIVRSGGRLAYEVEVLRGDTIGLTDSLESGVKREIELFAPAQPPAKTGDQDNADAATRETAGTSDLPDHANTTTTTTTATTATAPAADYGSKQAPPGSEPEYLTRLRTLTAVRAKLDEVIKVFGEAMQWPLAPSELSLTASIISVSAPETPGTGDGESRASREEKGKAYVEKLRAEIGELVGPGSNASAVEVAEAKIEEIRLLAEVWKGTAEEKARVKLVESLAKPIEERKKALDRAGGRGGARKQAVSSAPEPTGPSKGADLRYGNLDTAQGGYGFLQNLRNLKSDMYLE